MKPRFCRLASANVCIDCIAATQSGATCTKSYCVNPPPPVLGTWSSRKVRPFSSRQPKPLSSGISCVDTPGIVAMPV